MLSVALSKTEELLLNGEPRNVAPMQKYRVETEFVGLAGAPFSAYFGVIELSENNVEVGRKIQWLNDFSGTRRKIQLVFASSTKTICIIYRINKETPRIADYKCEILPIEQVRIEAVDSSLSEDFDTVQSSRNFQISEFPDFERNEIDTYLSVREFTMTPPESIYSLCKAVEYIASNRIPGAIVECGVWRGGSMMAVARTLLQLGEKDYHMYLFDTFEGMTKPTDKDLMYNGARAADMLALSRRDEQIWGYSPLEEVQKAVYGVGYDKDKIHFVKGKVEDTIPSEAPETIALLRLDTDWYTSTRHELTHLFPRLTAGGVLIIDDYGHWLGVRQATDEYIRESKAKLLLNRINYSLRIGVKLP